MDSYMDRYLGEILDDRYEITEIIGKGGMAIVYEALDRRLNRKVAVKVLKDAYALDATFRSSFQHESQAVAMLSHPNIVTVYDTNRSGSVEYIVMELIEGINLKQYMNSKEVLTVKEALHFGSQICKALNHAHAKGIVHSDIKPHNIMVQKNGNVKVADFGIAKLENSQKDSKSDETMGSVHYLSPEQAKGEPVDARCDIYSLGVILYEMLTGKLPCTGEDAVAVAVKHINGIYEKPRDLNPSIPEAFEKIVLKAMATDISMRYQSVTEMLKDLEAFRKEANKRAAIQKNKTATQKAVPIEDEISPVGSGAELTKEAYARRKTRSRKVSLMSGLFCIGVFLLVMLVFLWQYLLADIFHEVERINVPNFVGSYYSDILSNEEFEEAFNFEIVLTPDPTAPENMIIDQSIDSGRSMMLVDDGIDMSLTVSSGIQLIPIPNVINIEYREAEQILSDAGLKVAFERVSSDDYTKDYVISSSPATDESISVGSTVYLTVSDGPEESPSIVPNVVGLGLSSAQAKLEERGLEYSVTSIESDYPAYTIIWQSAEQGSEVSKGTMVYLQMSTGPEEEDEEATE